MRGVRGRAIEVGDLMLVALLGGPPRGNPDVRSNWLDPSRCWDKAEKTELRELEDETLNPLKKVFESPPTS